MAYFSNGSDGLVFDEQCSRCKFGDKPCPIALAQGIYNYDACNNKVATDILDTLVKNDGTCVMYKQFEDDLKRSLEDPNQISLF